MSWLEFYPTATTDTNKAYDSQVGPIRDTRNTSDIRDIQVSDIGKRVTIRFRESDGYHDLVGHLTSTSSIQNRHGQIIEFDPAKIFIWREINPVPRGANSGAPLSIRIYELERLLTETWRAKLEHEHGGWLLRGDGGITKRANSALVLNNTHSDSQIDEVIGWYRNLNLNPTIHLIPTLHQELDEALVKRGFTESLDALVMVKDHDQKLTEVDFDYEVSDQPTTEWLAAQNDQEIAPIMQRSKASYITLRSGRKISAVGRIGYVDDWAVLSRIWVAPSLRQLGLGRKILSAMEAEIACPKIALQVAKSNSIAINLYESFGYQTHHVYRFRELPQRIDLLPDLCC